MCGRFTLFHSTDAIAQAFNLTKSTQATPFQGGVPLTDIPAVTPHYNIAPSQEVATIRQEGETRQLQPMRWGLIPAWSKEAKIGNRLINARAETLSEKPSFRNAFKHRRCLIVADGFYEWQKEGTPKQPYYIRLKDEKLFAFAGLWEVWRSPAGEEIKSCTIITTVANDSIKFIHARMPVILASEIYQVWLALESSPPATVFSQSESLTFFPVDKMVNSSSNDNPNCLKPISLDG